MIHSCGLSPRGQLSDLGPITTLPRLEELDVERQALTSLCGLANMTTLRRLCLKQNDLDQRAAEETALLQKTVRVEWDGAPDIELDI